MQDIIKQRPILSLLPMCTTDAGLSITPFLAVTFNLEIQNFDITIIQGLAEL